MMEIIRTTVQHIRSFNEDARERYEYAVRVQMALCVLLVSAAYLHTVVRRLSPGLKALLSIIPVVIVNIWLPMLFSSKTEIVSRVVFALASFWLGNFKAVGLCLNRGPLAGNNWNLMQALLLYCAPIYPRQDGPVKKGRLTDSAGSTSQLFRLAAAHAVSLSLMAYVLAEVSLPVPVKNYLYSAALASFISFIMYGPAAVLTTLAELDVVPPFDKFWMSSSLPDFWGRRWNNTVGLTLRSLCYDPIVEGCWIHKGPAPPTHEQQQHADTPAAAPAGPESTAAVESAPSSGKGDSASKGPRVHPLKKLAGTAASFVASGIMHEFILLYALAEDDKYPAGVWFMMFFVQIPLIILEDIVTRRLRKAGVHLPRPLLILWTNFIVNFTTYFFWFPPVENYTGIALRVLTSVNESAAAAFGGLQALLQQVGLHPTAVGWGPFVGSMSTAA